jgi:hypothetical protein
LAVVVLLALSATSAVVSAEDIIGPMMFYGNVTLNGEPTLNGTVVTAHIGGESNGSVATEVEGKYYLSVEGGESDEGETITFKVCGAIASETAEWHVSSIPTSYELNLTAVDNEAPVVTDPNAKPSQIAADGVGTTRLNATVVDGCACNIDHVTVDLSAIGGSDAQEMECIGDGVYSVTTSVAVGIENGVYNLQVSASDRFGHSNGDVSIELEVVEEPPNAGDIDGSGDLTLGDAIYLAKHVVGLPGYDTIYANADIDGSGDVTLGDAIYLAKHVVGLPGYESIY